MDFSERPTWKTWKIWLWNTAVEPAQVGRASGFKGRILRLVSHVDRLDFDTPGRTSLLENQRQYPINQEHELVSERSSNVVNPFDHSTEFVK